MRLPLAILSVVLVCLLAACGASPRLTRHRPAEESVSQIKEKIDLPEESERMIVSEAKVKVKTDDPVDVHLAMVSLANKYRGYVVSSKDDRTVIRIPAIGLKDCLNEIETLGDVIEREIAGKDVTEDYLDLEMRLRTAEATRQRFLELLAEAKDLQQSLRLEQELQRITKEIEFLKRKIERLSHLIDYASVTVETVEEIRPGPIGSVFTGLAKGIKWLFVR